VGGVGGSAEDRFNQDGNWNPNPTVRGIEQGPQSSTGHTACPAWSGAVSLSPLRTLSLEVERHEQLASDSGLVCVTMCDEITENKEQEARLTRKAPS
jgi:hypothetical protein